MRVFTILPVFLVSLFLASGAQAQTAHPVAEPRDAVATMISAVAARDANAIAALYTDDAILLGSNTGVVSGREAIRDSWINNFSAGYAVLETGRPRTERGTDRAAVVFVWQATIQPNGRAATYVRGRSMLYFTQVDGGWLISADMWQPAPAPS